MNPNFMKSSFKIYFVLICLGIIQVSFVQIGATLTENEAISLLEQKRAVIQDYSFVISRSCYHAAYSPEKAFEIAQKVSEEMKEQILSNGGQLDSQKEKKIDGIADMNAAVLSNHEWNGNIYSLKGIGVRTCLYSMGSFISTLTHQMQQWLKSPQVDLLMNLTGSPTYRLNEVMIRIPGRIGVFHVGESDSGARQDIFQPAQPGELSIRELAQNEDGNRYMLFPFNHERALMMADKADLRLLELYDGNFILQIHPLEVANKFSIEVTFDSQGNVYKYSKIHILDSGEEWVEFTVSYYEYVNIYPGGIDLQIPRVGVLWINERKMDPTNSNDTAIPLRETSIVMSILSASLNVGYDLDDISVSLPSGSSLEDSRMTQGKRLIFDQPKQITARQISEANFE